MNWTIFAALLGGGWLVVEVVREFKSLARKEKSAYSLGYTMMRTRLNAPYIGPDLGYDKVSVENAYASILETFIGDDIESKAYMRGMREAVTEYERDNGAP